MQPHCVRHRINSSHKDSPRVAENVLYCIWEWFPFHEWWWPKMFNDLIFSSRNADQIICVLLFSTFLFRHGRRVGIRVLLKIKTKNDHQHHFSWSTRRNMRWTDWTLAAGNTHFTAWKSILWILFIIFNIIHNHKFYKNPSFSFVSTLCCNSEIVFVQMKSCSNSSFIVGLLKTAFIKLQRSIMSQINE